MLHPNMKAVRTAVAVEPTCNIATLVTVENNERKEETVLVGTFIAAPSVEPKVTIEDVENLSAEAVNDIEFKPKMAFHIVDSFTRVALPKGAKPDAEKYFLPHEVRPYPEKKMPCEYGFGSYEDLKQGMYYLTNGIDFGGRHWTGTSVGWVKSGDGMTVMFVPDDAKLNPDTIHEMMGMHAHLETSGCEGKYNKYSKRVNAMYRFASWGIQTSVKDDLLVYQSNGRRYKVRFDSTPMKAPNVPFAKGEFKIEGCGYATPEWAAEQLGPNPDSRDGSWKVGDTARITFTCNNFLFKGHILLWDMDVDLTLWDCKKQLTTDDVFVGFMGPLHAGDLRLNIQPIVNFGLQTLAEECGIKAMHGFRQEMKDRNALLRRIAMMYAAELNDENCVSLNNWRLMAAVKDGFDPETEPFMRRDLYKAYTKQNLEIENGRVPVPEEWGIRAYYFIDPWCIGRDGRFYMNRMRLVGNCVYSPRLSANEIVICYRDPQTPVEWQKVVNVMPPSGMRLVSDQVMLVSPLIAMRFAGEQGGGDYDDCGNILRGPFVTHWNTNRPNYPAKQIVEKAKQVISRWVEKNMFAVADGLNKPVWNKRKLIDLIQAAMDSDAGIGMIVNWLMVCIALSFYRKEIILDLRAQISMYDFGYVEMDEIAVVQLMEDLEWIEKVFVPFDEKDVAFDLEGAIDGIAMNGAKGSTDYNSLGTRIRNFWANCRVVPAWALEGGWQGNGRVPQSCKDKNPSVAYDPISLSLCRLKDARQQLDDYVNAMQWLKLQPSQLAIQTYPIPAEMFDEYDRKTRKTIPGIVSKAREMWRKDHEKISDKTGEAWYEAHKAICKRHRAALDARPLEWRLAFMAALENRIHDGFHAEPELFWAGHPQEGHPRPVADGYLNNREFFPYRRMLHKQEGLTKNLHFATLYPKAERCYSDIVDVTVKDGVISKLDNAQIIGLDLAIPDGTHKLVYGVLYL